MFVVGDPVFVLDDIALVVVRWVRRLVDVKYDTKNRYAPVNETSNTGMASKILGNCSIVQ